TGVIKTKDNPNGLKFTTQVKSRSVLGGRMIASEEAGLPGHEAYWLTTYDVNLKAYRFWKFNANGKVMEIGGGGGEAGQKMTWNPAGPDGSTSSGTWHWRGPDRREWTTVVRDAAGKSTLEIQAVSIRRGEAR